MVELGRGDEVEAARILREALDRLESPPDPHESPEPRVYRTGGFA
jgi:hypothetical protein